MHFNSLLPAANRVAVKSVRITPAQCEVELGCTAQAVSCLVCQVPSRRVHSRYVRVVQDLPWGGMPMTLRFWTRRFFCDNIDCRRRIFAEQLPALARSRARGTLRLEQTLVRIGLECGGEAVRGRDINVMTAWMERASHATSTREMNGFAQGLTRNWPEVKAAVELPWNNGRAEGHVNRLKLIKRKMFGRAKLDLLRIRVMASGP